MNIWIICSCIEDTFCNSGGGWHIIITNTCKCTIPWEPFRLGPPHTVCRSPLQLELHLRKIIFMRIVNYFLRKLVFPCLTLMAYNLFPGFTTFLVNLTHSGPWRRSMFCWGPRRKTRDRWWQRWWWRRGGAGRCWPGDRWPWQWMTSQPGDLRDG